MLRSEPFRSRSSATRQRGRGCARRHWPRAGASTPGLNPRTSSTAPHSAACYRSSMRIDRALFVLVVLAVAGCGKSSDEPRRRPVDTPEAATRGIDAGKAGATTGRKRPEWLVDDKPGTGGCRERDGGLDCSGVSPFGPDRVAAQAKAIDLAVDAMTSELAKTTGAAVPAVRTEVLAALGSPVQPDDHWWEEYEAESSGGSE